MVFRLETGLVLALWATASGCTSRDADVASEWVDAGVEAGSDGAMEAGLVLDASSQAETLRLPFAGYPSPPFPAGNAPSADKVMLGKALFWDVQLSSDNTVACGTCHQPAHGGADPRNADPKTARHPGKDGALGTADDPRGSPGIRRCHRLPDGGIEFVDDAVFGAQSQVTRRRSMSFLDAMFPQDLFWDGRARSIFVDPGTGAVVLDGGAALESQAVDPLLNSVEMACEGTTWAQVVDKISMSEPLLFATDVPMALRDFIAGRRYGDLFDAVFGVGGVTVSRLAMALASYERTLTSNDTPWDRFQAGDDAALTERQRRGLQVFVARAGCASCHRPPLFGVDLYFNDGFVADPWDQGRMEVTQSGSHSGAFRVVSLRNVGLRESGGLLHDGLWPGTDLSTLVSRYNLPPVYGSGPFRRALHLSQAEMDDLVEFLRHGLTDPRVAFGQAPFDHPRPLP